MPSPRRVVIDTNVWIGYFLFRNSVPRAAVLHAMKHDDIISSEMTMDELQTVLEYPKFRKQTNAEKNIQAMAEVRKMSRILPITECVNDCRDARDNKFLELAASGNASIIITGDADLLTLHPWRNVAILTPRQFLTLSDPSAFT